MATDASSPSGSTSPQLICPQCGYPNPSGSDRCSHCQKHLYILCSECDHVNFRGHSHCEKCQSPLRHSHSMPPPSHHLHWPFCWRMDASRKWLVPLQLLIFVSAVGLTSAMVFNFSGRCLPIPDSITETRMAAVGISATEDLAALKSVTAGKIALLGNLNGIVPMTTIRTIVIRVCW